MAEHDLRILAKTLWGEARGEGVLGMQAVACVILNRVAKPRWWGSTITGVCLKAWQFSCWNPGDPNARKLESLGEDAPGFREALDVARQAIAGTLDDITHGADHYYALSMKTPPRWALKAEPVAVIGGHAFFKLH